MNELFHAWGLQPLKALLTSLAMPPVVWLWPLLLGAVLLWRRRPAGWAVLLGALAGLWLGSTPWAAEGLTQALTRPPPALSEARIAALARQPGTAVVVLGAGRWALSPEYGMAGLTPLTAERLRYGAWLSRRTQLPLAYTGGIGHGALDGATEAEVAARVAREELGRPLRWSEGRARDTRENGRYTVALLAPQGIRRIVLVTHAPHQRRAMRAFAQAAAAAGVPLELVPAPVAVDADRPFSGSDLVPTGQAVLAVRYALHEWLGWLAGA